METIEKIMQEQFQRRNFKYRLFFSGLLFEKYIFKFDKIPKYKERGLLLRNYYFLMRYLDDIIDGDILIKDYITIDDKIKYLEEKLSNFTNKSNPKDDVDKMIKECHLLAEDIGFSMENESKFIINSLIFDGYRLLSWNNNKELKIVSSDELNKHFYDLDILGTISGCLKIYNENEENINALYYLGKASRKYYDMRDFVEDIKRGLVNISREDIQKFNITENDIYKVINISDEYIKICKNSFSNSKLLNILPESILNFLMECYNYSNENLDLYHNLISDCKLRNSTRLTLNLGYEQPIKKYLRTIKKN